MTEQNMHPAWMDDELVQDIPQEKMQFLSKLFAEANAQRNDSSSNASQKEKMLRLMPLLKQAQAANLAFTPNEMQAAIAAIKKHSTPEELGKIENILQKKNGVQEHAPL